MFKKKINKFLSPCPLVPVQMQPQDWSRWEQLFVSSWQRLPGGVFCALGPCMALLDIAFTTCITKNHNSSTSDTFPGISQCQALKILWGKSSRLWSYSSAWFWHSTGAARASQLTFALLLGKGRMWNPCRLCKNNFNALLRCMLDERSIWATYQISWKPSPLFILSGSPKVSKKSHSVLIPLHFPPALKKETPLGINLPHPSAGNTGILPRVQYRGAYWSP